LIAQESAFLGGCVTAVSHITRLPQSNKRFEQFTDSKDADIGTTAELVRLF